MEFGARLMLLGLMAMMAAVIYWNRRIGRAVVRWTGLPPGAPRYERVRRFRDSRLWEFVVRGSLILWAGTVFVVCALWAVGAWSPP